MEDTAYRAIAIVGAGAVLPDAPNVPAFWNNIKNGCYSIREVPPERWDPALYYDPDPAAPDKTYTKIGGWVRGFQWDSNWRLPVPPRVVAAMDDGQKWGVACAREALEDYGYPERPLDLNRTAVILGNAMAGETHYLTTMRVAFPEFARELEESAGFADLPEAIRRDIAREYRRRIEQLLPEITEDSMPGELSNCLAGRIANLFNFRGANYTVDAACASAMAALTAAAEGLVAGDYDVAITGGIDHNMGVSSFVKFCKIGALSATGSRPYAEGADGFVMGEGAALLVLKRLADAERDGDNIYAVLRGIGASSDGKGKGITAPNPIGQRLCIERGWQNAGLSPATVTYVEGHGTSTRVGDVVEVNGLAEVLREYSLPPHSVALGSVKSNIGHLKPAAGAAGMLKVALSLRDKVLPPSVQCHRPNPEIDFDHSPPYVNTELQPWTATVDGVRRAALSAFGFGGTNFHAVFEEYIPHRLTGNGKRSVAVGAEIAGKGAPQPTPASGAGSQAKAPLRGALVLGAANATALAERLREVQKAAAAGRAPAPSAPSAADLRASERLAIDYGDAAELADKAEKALKALAANQAPIWKALRAQGIFRGRGAAPKVAFLYTGQGSQYVNMLRALRDAEPIVADTFAEADRLMTPLLGKPLTEFVFVDAADAAAVEKAESDLRETAITQPTVLAIDLALTRLLAAYGIVPDMTMGHSLGEYGALVASGALPFDDAMLAVSARGRGMTEVAMEDNGRMAAVFAPLEEIERILKTIDGYVVIANINSGTQAVIGGASEPVEKATEAFLQAGYNAVPLPVSHAFHTSIVAPASVPLRRVLERLRLAPPRVPVVANVDGEFYPTGADAVPKMLDILARQVASPVQFVKGLRTLYDAGARVFVEVGPKKALQVFAEDVLGDRGDVLTLFTNHPKTGDIVAFNQALCGLYAAGLGRGADAAVLPEAAARPAEPRAKDEAVPPSASPAGATDYTALGRMFADVLDRGWQLYKGGPPSGSPARREGVTITGAALGLPGTERIFDDSNVARILRGDQLIDVIPARLRRAMAEKHITRLVKRDGNPTFEVIDSPADVLKLAGRGGAFDLQGEFGVSADRVAALDRVTQLAMAAGLDALRDAGIPLVMRYKQTSKGTSLPDRWQLPEILRDETGVIFASCWPGSDSFADEMSRYYADRARRDQIAVLESLLARTAPSNGDGLKPELERRIGELRAAIEKEPYHFDRRFVFRTLSMGHSQFAELIGARGPNTQVNAACASTTQAVALAEDWIQAGRCRRVIVISADDITSEHLLEWLGSGFLATGAASTSDVVEETALPFDRRRNGMIVGMGAAALVVESAEAVRQRGLRPISELLSAVIANSAFHGTRLDVGHIGQLMEKLVAQAEARYGVSRHEMAPKMVFVSHETYTPARGGSAAAEIHALRHVFGASADRVVIANTKGFTGHAMGAGIEDVVAVKALETGWVPPVANFKEADPELGELNLSRGGIYPVEYALRLGAGFGSQICMSLTRWVRGNVGARPAPDALGYAYRIADRDVWRRWLKECTQVEAPELEVVHRTLRVRDRRAAAPRPARTEEPAAERVRPVEVKPAVQAAAPSPAEQPKPAPAADPVRERVLAVVAEKTGYPADMLAPDLDLEADLGIDTVKQAEVFAAIREAYGIPREANLKLRDFPTLEHVVRFVHERIGDAAAPAPLPAVPAARPADGVQDKVLEVVAEKTGYPKDMLALDLDLEADLGIDTVKQAEVFAAIREAYGIPRDANLKLRDFPTLEHVIRFVHERRTGAPAPAPVAADAAPAPATPPDQGDGVLDKLLEIVSEKTGYPKDMLAPDLDLEADLGIDTVKQAEVFAAIREAYSIPRDASLKLRDFPTLSHVVRFVRERLPDAAPAAQPPAADPIQERVLDIVAEKTGYPKDMLDLDLDLEADLGIDTVKQAEMFAAIREAYNIPRDTNLKLRDFPTLAHVIRFARERAGGSVAPILAEEAPPAPTPAPLDAAGQVPRRVPVPVVRPPLELSKHTGVQLAGSRVVVAPDQGGIADALVERLSSVGAQVLLLDPAGDPEAQLKEWLAAGPVQGVYWLPALDAEGALEAMDLSGWREALRVRVKSLYATMRALYEQEPFLVSGLRLGGMHGYDAAGAVSPLGGAVAGFTKTYKRERAGALVKAVDFEPELSPAEVAAILVEETLGDPGAVEIGHCKGLRWTIGLEEQPAADGGSGLPMGKDTVFVITGAAGSIVSAITADLAAASGGTFYLLDLAPEPDPANPDLQRFATDRDGLKRELALRMQARGERPTPALIEKELAALERVHAAWSAIGAVRASGGTAHYFSVDLTDAAAVAEVLRQVRERSGRIDVLLHAAGMERSHFLPDKTPREFDLVFDVKADGWFNLLHALGDMPLGAAVVFSSIAGRFGNAGQADYSAANDLLCKIVSSFRTTRTATRGIAIDWTAWGGIGMASRGSIPKMMEMAGIDMLPPEAGIPVIRRELTLGATRGEVVVAGRLGVLLEEWDETGGVDASALEKTGREAPGPMIGKPARASLDGRLAVETTLDPKLQPFLNDHRIDGTAVLPGVMGIEAFAEAALLMAPGWHVDAIEAVEFLAPFKFYHDDVRTLSIEAKLRSEGESLVAECLLLGRRALPNLPEPQVTTHFAGRVRLARQPEWFVRAPASWERSGSVVDAEAIYRAYFHGPAYRVLRRVWINGGPVVGELNDPLPANHHPEGLPLWMGPRLIELCFQTAGVWEMAVQGRMGLPRYIESVRVSRTLDIAGGPLYAVVTPHPERDCFDAEVVDADGRCYVSLAGYRTIPFAEVPNDLRPSLHATA